MAKLCETHEISQRAGRSLHRLRLQELPPSNLLLSGWTQGIPNLGEHTCQCGLKGSQSARKSNCNQSGDECILNRRNPFVFSQESCSELFHFRPRNFSISFVFTLHVMKVRSVPWPMILSFIDTGLLHCHTISSQPASKDQTTFGRLFDIAPPSSNFDAPGVYSVPIVLKQLSVACLVLFCFRLGLYLD